MNGNTMRELDNGRWSEIVPSQCPCRGGWLLSDYDTWHRCPLHGKGVPHPEDDGAEFDFDAHHVQIHRAAWVALAGQAGLDLPCFGAAVKAVARATGAHPETPVEWVALAAEVAEAAWVEASEARARADGFSCRLEASLAEEAAIERRDAGFRY